MWAERVQNEALNRIPLYVAAFGAALVGVASLSIAVNDSRFAGIIFGLLAIGFTTSWGTRAGLIKKQLMEKAILLMLGGILAAMYFMPDLRYEFLPASGLTSLDSLMVSLLAWMMVIYSFNLRSDRAVLFICVPVLSLVGLIGTFGVSAEVLTFFIMFVCFAAFALVEQNALSAQEGSVVRSHSRKVVHALVAGKVVVCAILMGLLVGQVVFWGTGGKITGFFVGRQQFLAAESLVGGDFMPVCTGPVALGDEEVMTVQCEEGFLWRSQVYDTYTGRGWVNTTYEWEQNLIPKTRWVTLGFQKGRKIPLNGYAIPWDANRLGMRTRVREVQQTFRSLGTPMVLVYGAAEPVFVAFQRPVGLRRVGGSLRTSRPYGAKNRYIVISSVSTATRAELENAGTDYPEFIADRYCDVPPSCWQVQRITDKVTSGLTNPYEKVIAIKDFLEKEYVYDAAAPAAPPQEDVVTYFLLKSRRGYCDVFASAMAIMCRQAGVPARVVSGFATGVYNEEDGLFHVQQKDRHAWTEVYFPNYGWIAFDLAPAEGSPALLARISKLLARAYRAVTAGGFAMAAMLVLAVLALYLVKVRIIDRRRNEPQWVADLKVSRSRAVQNYKRMCRMLAGIGYPRLPTLTPLEYAAELSAVLPTELSRMLPTIEAITSDFIEVRYGRRELPEGRINESAVLLEDFARAIRGFWMKRLRKVCIRGLVNE